MCAEIDKILVYRFPKKKTKTKKKKKQREREREREQWIKSVPNANLNVTNNIIIC